jgi:hypothetical protein
LMLVVAIDDLALVCSEVGLLCHAKA